MKIQKEQITLLSILFAVPVFYRFLDEHRPMVFRHRPNGWSVRPMQGNDVPTVTSLQTDSSWKTIARTLRNLPTPYLDRRFAGETLSGNLEHERIREMLPYLGGTYQFLHLHDIRIMGKTNT